MDEHRFGDIRTGSRYGEFCNEISFAYLHVWDVCYVSCMGGNHDPEPERIRGRGYGCYTDRAFVGVRAYIQENKDTIIVDKKIVFGDGNILRVVAWSLIIKNFMVLLIKE